MRSMLKDFPTEKIKLLKTTGETIEGIVALVGPKKIHVEDVRVLIEEDDIFERALPNGAVERYRVLDRGFHKGMFDIPDHYQISVEKITSIPRQRPASAVYNIQNDGGKINIQSTDNSINLSLSVNDEKLFETLMRLAEPLPNKADVIRTIKEMKQSAGKPTFSEKYNRFIQLIANHITIFAPFIPTLTEFLIK